MKELVLGVLDRIRYQGFVRCRLGYQILEELGFEG